MKQNHFAYLQVTLIGMGAFLGGMMTLTPECLQPLMAPPLASTMKETRNLGVEAFGRLLAEILASLCPKSVRRSEETVKHYFRVTFGALLVYGRQSLKRIFKLSLRLTFKLRKARQLSLKLVI